ncbi:MAG: SseB family protein [Alphaproteobacteria bacterium]|nr:SseB family protein [Alphaproteobacteria bacterium]MBV9692959.1 SseB family protein [Alphaproteobacteria bacterium]
MSFEPENALEEALLRANKSPMTRREFERQLLGSDVIVIGEIEGRDLSPAGAPLLPGERLKVAFTKRDGRTYVPVFTSRTRLHAYLSQSRGYVSLPGRALMEMTRGATLLLNLGSDVGKEILPEEIARMLDPGTLGLVP